MKKLTLRLAGAAALALVLAAPGYAEPSPEPRDGANVGAVSAKEGGNSAVEVMQASATLAEYARANNDAIAMVKAAEMLASAGAVEVERTPESVEREGEGDADAEAKRIERGAETVESLLGEAEMMADGDAVVLALIADARAAATKGAVGGPKFNVATTPAKTLTTYRVSFYGAQVAEIGLRGDGSTDLDLYIYDENGNLICADSGRSDRGYCRFTPRWTGAFTIRVRNNGFVSNRYTVVTN